MVTAFDSERQGGTCWIKSFYSSLLREEEYFNLETFLCADSTVIVLRGNKMGNFLYFTGVVSVCFDVVSMPANSNFLALNFLTDNNHTHSLSFYILVQCP